MPKRLLLGLLVLLNLLGYTLPVFTLAQNDEAIIISDLDWKPDGSQIAIGISAIGMEARCVTFPMLPLMDVATKQLVKFPQIYRNCSVTNLDFSTDGTKLLTTSESAISIWDADTGQPSPGLLSTIIFKRPSWRPNSTLFLDVNAYTVDIRNSADLTDESYPGFLSPGRLEGQFFTDAVWSSDGSSIASSLTDGMIYVWDTTNTNILQSFSAHKVAVRRLIWNAELNLIASGDDDGKILVWNPTTGEIVTELKGHTGAIRDLDWSMDGQKIVSAGADNTVRTWAWPSGEMQLVESDQSIWSVAYSPDGNQLAYGGELNDDKDIVSHITIVPTGSATVTPQP